MHFIGGEPGQSLDRIVVGGFDVRERRVPIVLLLVEAHGYHEGHGVVDALDAAVGEWVVGAGVDLVDAETFVEGDGELSGELHAVVGDESHGAPPKRYVLVDENVSGAGGGELGCFHRVHVGTAAEAVGEETDVGFATWSQRQWAEVVDADGDTWAVA